MYRFDLLFLFRKNQSSVYLISQHLNDRLKEREEKVHVLINNSGIAWGAPFDTFPDSAWDKVLAINLKTVFNMTR